MVQPDKKSYNTTDLDPLTTFERHVYHRDQFAHYLRWTHILKQVGIGDTVVDFGCGNGNLLEVLYRNRRKCTKYIGFDIREKTIEKALTRFEAVDWAEFDVIDLVKSFPSAFHGINADHVCSFEVLEHIGKTNAPNFLENFLACGGPNAIYYLSTPNFDPAVGAAGNHTYDCNDGNGYRPQEFFHEELHALLGSKFDIIAEYGTFASQKDYKHLMTDAEAELFYRLSAYYDSNLISVLMAPLFPHNSRNTMWVMKSKTK